MQFSRRTLLGAGATGLLASFAGLPAESQQKMFRKRPKNIIFCVADGMAMSVVTMADYFRQITEGRRSYWGTLLNEEYATSGLQETRSLNSVVTDSSAASSTWGSGRRIWNGQINMYPDGTSLRPLVSLMQEAGMRCGLVTTTTMTHATPAGFAVNCLFRRWEEEIAEKYLKAGVDVLMGGGSEYFTAEKRKDKRDLYGEFANAGYTVVKTKSEMANLRSAKKILGIFNQGHMPYTVDYRNNPDLQRDKPTLREMVQTAIDNLKHSPNGFLLQVEGGRVDHGAHTNDLAAMLYDQMAFEEALQTIVEFARKDRNTLVVITSDHATGGPALNGAGAMAYGDSTGGLQRLANMKASYETLLRAAGTNPDRSKIQDVVKTYLDIGLKNEEADAVVAATQKKPPFGLSEFYRSTAGTLSLVLGNHTKVTWTSQNHTSDHVLVTAVGPGRELFAGLNDNIHFFDLMLAAKELKYANPTMDFATAKMHFEKIKHNWDSGG